MTEPFAPLIAELRADADRYARDGVFVDGAKLLSRVADQVETAQRAWLYELLTLEQAADESGQSYSTLQKKVRAGNITNAGSKHPPRVRRCDLLQPPHSTGPDLAGLVLRTTS